MVEKEKNYTLLNKLCKEKGITLFGVAEVSHLHNEFYIEPKSTIEDLHYGISLGVRLSDRIIDQIIDGPTLLYSWHYRQVNALLDQTALFITIVIQEQGYSAIPVPASQIINWQKQIGHLSHRKVGAAAGHGWIGRNGLLIHPKYGARVRYATVLTNLPITTDVPISTRGCDECHACVKVCPAQAIAESPNDFNFVRCFEQLTHFAKKKNIGHYICGICLKACAGKT